MAGKRRSIAWPIFALVVASVVVATVVMFAVTFRGPPERRPPLKLEAVAGALQGGDLPSSDLRLERVISPDMPLPKHQDHAYPAGTERLARILKADPARVRVMAMEPQRDTAVVSGPFTATWHDGTNWRSVHTARPSWLSPWHRVTLTVMAVMLVLLAIAAWLVARAITRPLQRLAGVAVHSRPGRPLPMPRGGPREVDALAEALNQMQDRMSRAGEARTTMFAAIAHDLGTPLSRVAFWIEQLPEAARERAAADIDEMRAMLGDVLRFARDERVTTTDRIDLGSVLDSLVDDLAAAGTAASITPGDRVLVRGDSASLRRLFANLIDNAVRYGGAARVGWTRAGSDVVVTIDDDGPGFDAADGDRLFEPFVRGDPSRSRATGGTGLGLAIVRSIAEAHGGSVALGRHAAGGRVTVTLPASN